MCSRFRSSPAFITNYEDWLKYKKRKVISIEDYRAVVAGCTDCASVGALQSSLGKIVSGSESSTDTQIRGYTWAMPEMQNLNIVQGRGFTPSDDEHGSHVALIGSDIQENLLKGDDPLGHEIRVDGVPYTIIGAGGEAGKDAGAEPGQLGGGSADLVSEDLRNAEDPDDLRQRGNGAGADGAGVG